MAQNQIFYVIQQPVLLFSAQRTFALGNAKALYFAHPAKSTTTARIDMDFGESRSKIIAVCICTEQREVKCNEWGWNVSTAHVQVTNVMEGEEKGTM